MDFAWPGVEHPLEGVQLLLAVLREVGALGEELANQAICVLVGAALPGAVGIGEVDLQTGALSLGFVARHFLALIVGQGSAQASRDAFEGSAEALQRRFGIGRVEFVQQDQAAEALHQRADGRAVAGALD